MILPPCFFKTAGLIRYQSIWHTDALERMTGRALVCVGFNIYLTQACYTTGQERPLRGSEETWMGTADRSGCPIFPVFYLPRADGSF